MRGNFRIGTFNVRGLNDEQKQECLARDIDSYKLDVCVLQEDKLEDGIDCAIGDQKHRFISIKPDCRHYGNGFVVSSKWKQNIHRCWKVSDRVAVLQLLTESPEYKCEKIDDTKLKIQRQTIYTSTLNNTKLTIKKVKHKGVISIINVYAPHTERVKTPPNYTNFTQNSAIRLVRFTIILNVKLQYY